MVQVLLQSRAASRSCKVGQELLRNWQRLQSGTILLQSEIGIAKWSTSVDAGLKLNVHKAFRRRLVRLLNVLCTFNLRPVSTRTYQNVGQYRSVNICFNSSLCHEIRWEEWRTAIDFAARHFDYKLRNISKRTAVPICKHLHQCVFVLEKQMKGGSFSEGKRHGMCVFWKETENWYLYSPDKNEWNTFENQRFL